MIRPEWSAIGETDSEMSTKLPSFRSLVVS